MCKEIPAMTYGEMRTRVIKHLMELEVPFEETFAGYAFPDIELKAASKVIYNIPSVKSFFIIEKSTEGFIININKQGRFPPLGK